jgi:small ligand-binding sensory domain FIST
MGVGLSLEPDSARAAAEAATQACAEIGEGTPSLAAVFASSHHAARADEVIEAVNKAAGPERLLGCVAEAVVGGAREIEAHPAVSVWLAGLPAVPETFHLQFVRAAGGGVFAGWQFDHTPRTEDEAPELHLLIADPYTFPADLLLRHLNESAPGTVVMGGMASGGGRPGDTRLFLDDRVVDEGAVGARIPGVRVRTLVSQGCRPVGSPLTVTRAEGGVVQELGGRTPLDRLREVVAGLSDEDRALLAHGVHVGRVIDEYKAERAPGDFLIRGVVGADEESGAIVVGDAVEVGETIQFHVRDAETADEELRSMLATEVSGLGSGRPAGALLFTCNGRGSHLFSVPDHDAALVSGAFGGLPLAGFFCAGELGPVGGKNFLHGFTASVALFEGDAGS